MDTETQQLKLSGDMAANTFSGDFLSSSPVRGETEGKSRSGEPAETAAVAACPEEVLETSSQSGSDTSVSPCPGQDPAQVLAAACVWSGRKEGDSGFISPAGGGAASQGHNPFYEASFHPGLNKTSSNDYESSKTPSLGTEPEDKVLDSSLESENDVPYSYDDGHQNQDDAYKTFNIYEQDTQFDKTDNYFEPKSDNTVNNVDILDFKPVSAFEDIENYSSLNNAQNGLNNENYMSDEDSNEDNEKTMESHVYNDSESDSKEKNQDSEMPKEDPIIVTSDNTDVKEENCMETSAMSTGVDETENLLTQKIFSGDDSTCEVDHLVEEPKNSNGYDYKLTQEDGCIIPDSMTMSVMKNENQNEKLFDESSDEESQEEVENEEKDSSSPSSEDEEEQQPYEKLQEVEEFSAKEESEKKITHTHDTMDVYNSNILEETSSNDVHLDQEEHKIDFKINEADDSAIQMNIPEMDDQTTEEPQVTMKEEDLLDMTPVVASTQDSLFVAETIPNIEASEVTDSDIEDNEAPKIVPDAMEQVEKLTTEDISSAQADQPQQIEAVESSDEEVDDYEKPKMPEEQTHDEDTSNVNEMEKDEVLTFEDNDPILETPEISAGNDVDHNEEKATSTQIFEDVSKDEEENALHSSLEKYSGEIDNFNNMKEVIPVQSEKIDDSSEKDQTIDLNGQFSQPVEDEEFAENQTPDNSQANIPNSYTEPVPDPDDKVDNFGSVDKLDNQDIHSDILPEDEVTSKEANFEPIESHDTVTEMLNDVEDEEEHHNSLDYVETTTEHKEEAITEPALPETANSPVPQQESSTTPAADEKVEVEEDDEEGAVEEDGPIENTNFIKDSEMSEVVEESKSAVEFGDICADNKPGLIDVASADTVNKAIIEDEGTVVTFGETESDEELEPVPSSDLAQETTQSEVMEEPEAALEENFIEESAAATESAINDVESSDNVITSPVEEDVCEKTCEIEESIESKENEMSVEKQERTEIESTVSDEIEAENVNAPADATSIETTTDYQPPSNDRVINDTNSDDTNPKVEENQATEPQIEEVKLNEKVPTDDVAKLAKSVVKSAAPGAKKSPKPPSTLALTKTTPKAAGRAAPAPAAKPRVPRAAAAASPRPSARPGSGAVPLTSAKPVSTGVTRAAPRPAPRPATAPTTTRAAPPRPQPGTRPMSSTAPGPARLPRQRPQPEQKPAAAKLETKPEAPRLGAVRMKITPRPTSTSRLREASAARAKAELKVTSPASKATTPARTPLSARAAPPAKTPPKRTPTKPSSASASSKELANTPFAKRQARLRAKSTEKKGPVKREAEMNGHADLNGSAE